MSLLKKVEEILVQIDAENQNRSEAVRRAEELADKYCDVKPKTDVASPELYMGLPAFSK